MPERDQILAVGEHFGRNLRRVRRRQDLTQEMLARRAAVHRTYIGLLENAERVCGIDVLIRLAGALDVSPLELLDGIDWVPGPEPEPGGAFNFRSMPIPTRSRPAMTEPGE
jgi:transcriptional regulator with XRE-family HTH domain